MLCNAAGLHDASTAELAVALALASGRHLDVFARNQESGTWGFRFGRALADQRVLIVGYGTPASAPSRTACWALRSRRSPGWPAAGAPGRRRSARLRICPRRCQFGCGLRHRSAHAADRGHVRGPRARPPARRRAAGQRGPVKLVDTSALLSELSAGRITAALDVTDPEPLPPDHPLWRAPGVLISPHVGGASSAFAPRADRFIAAELARYAAGQPLASVARHGSGAENPPL